MNSSYKLIAITASLSLLLTSCGTAPVSLYFISAQPKDGMQKIGCEEYLIPVEKSLKKTTLEETIKTLLTADPAQYGQGLSTASAFTDGYLEVDSTSEPESPTNSDPYRLYLKTVAGKGLSGACDTPRLKAQITETVGAYARRKQAPFQIVLNGLLKNWECLGDESGRCK